MGLLSLKEGPHFLVRNQQTQPVFFASSSKPEEEICGFLFYVTTFPSRTAGYTTRATPRFRGTTDSGAATGAGVGQLEVVPHY